MKTFGGTSRSKHTGRTRSFAAAWLLLISALSLRSQSLPLGWPATWRQTGNLLMERSLAGPASGAITRVWYSGHSLFAQTQSGRVFENMDLDTWRLSNLAPAALPASIAVKNLPESGAVVRSGNNILYAYGKYVWRSEDSGLHWDNKTFYRGRSLVGHPNDLAVNPDSDDNITVATSAGVFHSADGGISWISLNDGLPNLPATRIWALPSGDQGVQLATDDDVVPNVVPNIVQWEPGQKAAWLPATNPAIIDEAIAEISQRANLSAQRGKPVTALANSGDFIYTGMRNGELSVSADGGKTWIIFTPDSAGPVQRFWVSPQDARVAVAVLGAGPNNPFRVGSTAHVLRTLNGGAFWDDITGNLPDAAASGVAVDLASKAIYVASSQGLFLSYTDLNSLGAAAAWTPLAGLPVGVAVHDVKLDAQGNQLWVALDGYGVFSTLAPHRLRDPKVVSAGDMISRAVAPGSLISVLGAKLDTVRVGNLQAPVLASSASSTEIQIPFGARADTGASSLTVSGTSGGATFNFSPLTLSPVSPVIFVSADGAPMLLDADQGVMLDAANPAHSGTSIQILASGLGRVTPEWPSGLAAPLANPPKVAGTVHAFLDRIPVEVTQAALAPGYVGFYLIEIKVPKIVNYGPAELQIDVSGVPSNPVRVYIEP